MKKILISLILICLFLTGCFNKKDDSLNKILKKYSNLNSYILTGDLEIINNEDRYNYDVKVIYQKKDKFYVSLKNRGNNHEQIILKNEDGVYVVTPSLNKSFKFQSDWPYNNSQSYLIGSIISDIEKDKNRSVTSDNNRVIFTTDANYPNNRKLVRQVVEFDNNYNLKSVSVTDENDIVQMKMTFQTIDLKPENINKDTFDLNKIITIDSNSKEETEKEKEQETLEEIVYPLYIPTGTVLSNSEKVSKEDGERVIMTFEGEKPFLLVEETASIEKNFSIIPTYGEPYLLIDTVAALTDNSLSWNSNGIDYYLVSDVLSQNELVDIARSVSTIPVMK